MAGLRRDKTRPSRVPPLPRETRLKVITMTVQETLPNVTHWSRALMAEAAGISPSSVGRIWAEAGLKPHLVRGFKVSSDLPFLAPADTVHRRLHIVVDTAIRNTTEDANLCARSASKPFDEDRQGQSANACQLHL